MVASEKDTGGFLAPSITILARDGWKGNATVDKCQERLSKLNFSLRQIHFKKVICAAIFCDHICLPPGPKFMTQKKIIKKVFSHNFQKIHSILWPGYGLGTLCEGPETPAE